MQAADLRSEHIGQMITVEADYGPSGRISATGQLTQVSHGYSAEGALTTVRTTSLRLSFTDAQSAEIILNSEDEVQSG